MRTGVVSSTQLTVRTLHARDYVFSPEHEADRLIDDWMRDNPGFMHRSTAAMKDLRTKLVEKLNEALTSNAKKA